MAPTRQLDPACTMLAPQFDTSYVAPPPGEIVRPEAQVQYGSWPTHLRGGDREALNEHTNVTSGAGYTSSPGEQNDDTTQVPPTDTAAHGVRVGLSPVLGVGIRALHVQVGAVPLYDPSAWHVHVATAPGLGTDPGVHTVVLLHVAPTATVLAAQAVVV